MVHRAKSNRKIRLKVYKLLKSYRDQGFRNKEIAQALAKLQAEGHPHLVEYNAKRWTDQAVSVFFNRWNNGKWGKSGGKPRNTHRPRPTPQVSVKKDSEWEAMAGLVIGSNFDPAKKKAMLKALLG